MNVAAISGSLISWIVLVILLLAWFGYYTFQNYQVRQVATYLSNEEFRKGMRRAQVIDLREKSNFKSGHILGARSLPYSTLRSFYAQIRADLPVYLYDQGRTVSKRAAVLLGKKGYKNIYILKTGYQNWDGKEKKDEI
ncbi:rhodanese-like domain-containing protein [Lentilactobacillus sp. SPB1-3]|uniref:Rhodanese-like domain-containing protein n=1 Tax=Lentilactobacillus terminaliae TaxID=3003483 RepID=A0ACD5DBQ9_9LACO|nr:rhodanese-like domain-containing protein [Lentilactobacillus sp. SPB1-3]MCZ0977119.1 rhodanese-like domain-containing protein [Lentilactobacillus sp. SPB1-3]